MAQGLKFDNGDFISLSGATTGTGLSVAMHNVKQVGWFTEYTGTPSAGVISIEWAPSADYAQTWTQIGEITASLLAAGTDGSGTFPGPISGFLRARITTPIAGGTVTVRLNGLLA